MDAERWRHVEALFHQALERDEPARSRFLDEQCADDLDLRREVERWLAADARAPAHLAAALSDAVRSFHTAFAPGARIGPYEIVGLRGEGGMGSVYRARRIDDVFHKEVAIKVVKRGLDSGALLDRFRRERQILARLEHPYIARVLDGGRTDEGLPYLVMEYVEGQTLLEYARGRQLDVTARLRLFSQVCEAVAHAHQHQIVHRDLKPNNILVDAQGRPRLLDFGIAKLTSSDGPGARQELTSTGNFGMLTPRYASPEHVKGEPITAASDVYSLGVILYELLTGCAVHRATGDSPAAILKAVCEDVVPPPSVAAATASAQGGGAEPIAPDALKGDLDRIALKALEKGPRRRYASVDALADDVRRHVGHLPLAARSPTAGNTLGFVRRHRPALTVSLLGTLAVMLGVGYYRVADRMKPTLPAGRVMLAALPLENLTGSREQEVFIDGLHEEIISRLGRLQPDRLGVIARTSTLQFRDTTKSIAAIGDELGAHYILEGSVRQAGERVSVTAQLIQVSDQTQLWARPLSASVQKLMFFVHLAGRRWQKAEDAVRRLAEVAPDDSSHIYFASFLLALRGDCSGARDQLAGRAPLRVGSGVTDEDYLVAYILGRCGTPREVAREVTSLEMRPLNYAQTIAVLDAGAGDRANALRWREESFRRREPLLFFVAVDPSLEFLRSEPRLQALLQKMGLQQN